MPGDAQGIGVPLSLFGGMVTELSAPSLPEGVSPDCQDVIFVPGSVASRPCLEKLFENAFPNNVTMLYQKTFVQPNEDPLNLFIDSANNLWQEDTGAGSLPSLVSALPYASGSILQVLSATQFGREYIACSDGFHGAAVPLQFDGTNLDRVTQDGPAQAPSVSDDTTGWLIDTLANSVVQSAAANISSLSELDGVVTVVTATPWGFGFVNEKVVIAGAPTGYNGTVPVASVISATSFTFVSSTLNLASAGAGGTVTSQAAAYNVKIQYNVSGQLPLNVTGTRGIPGLLGTTVVVAGLAVAGYNGTWVTIGVSSWGAIIRNLQIIANIGVTGLASTNTGTMTFTGNVSVGVHGCAMGFITRQGQVTKLSPTTSWSAAGGKRAVLSNLAIGPSNVIGRFLVFTGAGGGNYFGIPTNLQLPNPVTPNQPIFIAGTVVLDNVSTSVAIDFSDNALFGGTAVDIPGRNYFAQTVLSDCLGVFPYASRMFWWGVRNNIQNMLNMGFEGGYQSGVLTVPFGWKVVTAGGTLINGGAWPSGMAWQITDDGSGNPRGQLSQSAYQDSLGIAILQPNTQYSFRCWILPSAVTSGNLLIELVGTGLALSVTASLTLVPAAGTYITATFVNPTGATIPSDAILRVSEQSMGNGNTIVIDELQLYPTIQPYNDALFRASYVNAPEQFDAVTGNIGSASDPSPIRNVFQLRNTMYFHTVTGLHSTSDNGLSEPSAWNVPEVTQSVGGRSVHGCDAGKVGTGESGEQLAFVANENGLYIFNGGETIKISQEIQAAASNGMPGWVSINKAAIHMLWIKNDIRNRRLYIGAPTGTALAPNVLFVMDYRELNDFAAIAGNGPTRESLQGRMIAKEFCRKWTRWNITANCGEILSRPGGITTFCVGAGNGVTPGGAPGFANVYDLSTDKLTDDDYGQVVPYYTTYFFVSRDQEQQLQLDVHRKLATYLSMFISGTGSTAITPLSDTLANPFPSLAAYPLSTSQNHDFEWAINVSGERIALQIGSVPLTGQTDNGFNLQHLALTMKKEPMSPLRGAI